MFRNNFSEPIHESSSPSFTIINPSDIQLSSPGNKVGSGIPQEIMTEFPVFTFFSDGTEFILHVFEKLSHHNSIEDVINSGNPICSEPLPTPVFNYALTTTGQPLQVGHTYYWYSIISHRSCGSRAPF